MTIDGLTLGGAQASDYALTPPTTTANINQATLTVTGITAIDRAYDGTTDVQLDTSAAVLNGVWHLRVTLRLATPRENSTLRTRARGSP